MSPGCPGDQKEQLINGAGHHLPSPAALAPLLSVRWPARVVGLTLLADRVRLDLDGQPHALVDVTPAAVADLSLAAGTEVWASVKATDLEVYPHSERQSA